MTEFYRSGNEERWLDQMCERHRLHLRHLRNSFTRQEVEAEVLA